MYTDNNAPEGDSTSLIINHNTYLRLVNSSSTNDFKVSISERQENTDKYGNNNRLKITITALEKNRYFTGSKTFNLFIIDTNCTYKKGDIDGDGKITATDARLAAKISAKLEPYVKAADLDGDGIVTSTEARKILRVSAKLDSF